MDSPPLCGRSRRSILTEDPAQRIRHLAQRRQFGEGFSHRIKEVAFAFSGALQAGNRPLDGRVVPTPFEVGQAFGLPVADGLVDHVELHVGIFGTFRSVAVDADDYSFFPLYLPLVAVGGVFDLALHEPLLDGLYRTPQLVDAADVVPRLLLDRVGKRLYIVGAGERV